MILISMPIGTYVVVAFSGNAPIAMAAEATLRGLDGGKLPIASSRMFQALGYGWEILGSVSLRSPCSRW